MIAIVASLLLQLGRELYKIESVNVRLRIGQA